MLDLFLKFSGPDVLEDIEALSSEHLDGANMATIAPPLVSGEQSESIVGVGLGSD